MTKIETIWEELTKTASSSDRLVIRRFSPAIHPDVYVGLKVQEGLKCLVVRLSTEVVDKVSLEEGMKDIRVEILPNERDEHSKFLLFTLIDHDLTRVFAVLCEDLINAVSNVDSEHETVTSLFERVGRWRLLFEKYRGPGLSDIEQRGLYGEIYFLRRALQDSALQNSTALSSWVGPKMVPKDFQAEDWGIEVKTTTSRNHQRIRISNELQLDDSNLRVLYLYHLSLEEQLDNGESLPEIIKTVREILLKDNPSLRTTFDANLLRVNYFEEHQSKYERKGYFIREELIFRIEESFPRIIEKHIPKGVGDVTYSIDVGACIGFSAKFEELIKAITNAR